MMPRAYQPWSFGERALLAEWKGLGRSNREIADRLQRSIQAIESMSFYCGLRRAKRRALPPVQHVEMMAVPKDDVPSLYEKGWRFEQFSAEGLCVMRKERRL